MKMAWDQGNRILLQEGYKWTPGSQPGSQPGSGPEGSPLILALEGGIGGAGRPCCRVECLKFLVLAFVICCSSSEKLVDMQKTK